MTSYEKYLEKCYHISSIYIQHLLKYQSFLYDDPDLSPQVQTKMKDLLLKFIERIEEFLNVLRSEQDIAQMQGKDLHRELIAEEFLQINNYIDKLFDTTRYLQQAKDLIDLEIKEEFMQSVKLKRKKRTIRPFQYRTINDIWYDSVAEEYFKNKPESVNKKLKTVNKSLDITSYSEGFQRIQQEFSDLRKEIRKVKEEPHRHKVIEKRLQEVGIENLKIASNNKIVQQEQGELLSQLHKLVKRIQVLESENEVMINKLKRMLSRQQFE